MKDKGLMINFGTRRDACHFIGRRAAMLKPKAAASAWAILARRVEAMGEMDVPKFKHLIKAVRAATIEGFTAGRTRKLRVRDLTPEERKAKALCLNEKPF